MNLGNKNIFFWFCFSILANIAGAEANTVSAPDLRCISVASSGAVTINWIIPPDPSAEFVNYKIYSSSNASGPFTLVNTITSYPSSSYTDNSVNANLASRFYYIVTSYNSGGIQESVPSDTLQSMRLVVISISGTAILKWNSIHQGGSEEYFVYQKKPAGAWKLIDSTSSISDTITIRSLCNTSPPDSLYFKIQVRDPSGCISVSSDTGATFRDQTYPVVTTLDSVTVLNSKSEITWLPNNSEDTKGYIIFRFDEITGSTTIIDTVFGVSNVNYQDLGCDPNTKSCAYKVSAFDSCNNIAPWVSYQRTIYLTTALNRCAGTIELNWNPYLNWSPGVNQYQIFVKQDTLDFILAGTVSGSDTSYSFGNLAHGATYCFYINAIGSGGRSSTSNVSCTYVNTPKPPAFCYLTKVDVVAENQISLSVYVDVSSDIKEYIVQKALLNGSFSELTKIPRGTNSLLTITDDSVETSKESYVYQVLCMDSCGNNLKTSNRGQSIFLMVKANNDLTNTLKWNPYQEFAGGTESYQVYRSINGEMGISPIAVLPDTSTTFIDDVGEFRTQKGDFCYLIKAAEEEGNPYGFEEESNSELFCVQQLPKLYIPNTFTPNGDGLNDVFLPINVFVDAGGYSFIVYNRKGQKIFETSDVTIPWDGFFRGELAPQGVYAFYIHLLTGKGDSFDRTGTITLLR